MFCCLFWFLTKKRGFSGLLKNLKSLSRIKFFFVSFRAAQMRAKPSTRRCEPTRVVQNRIQNVVFREKPPATRPSRLRARGWWWTGVTIRAHTFRRIKKKREERQKKGATERTYRFGDDRRSFLGCRHRSRRRRRDPRVAARAARR